MPYMVTFTINIPQMLAYIYHTWILWDRHINDAHRTSPGHSHGGRCQQQFGDRRSHATAARTVGAVTSPRAFSGVPMDWFKGTFIVFIVIKNY